MTRTLSSLGGACLFLVAASSAAQPPAEPKSVPVLVAKKKIPAFTFIKKVEDFFEVVEKPTDSLPKNYFSALNDKDLKEGFAVARAIPEGGYVTRDDLVPKGIGNLEAALPPGMRAVSIKVTVDQLVGGFILPGSRVDVISTVRREKDIISQTILQKVLVLAVDTLTQRNGDKTTTILGNTVTLAVTPEDAQKLSLAATRGELRLTLRPLGDDKKVPLRETKEGDLEKQRKEPDKEKPKDPPQRGERGEEVVAPKRYVPPNGMRTVTVDFTIDEIVGGLALPGSKVDVTWTTRAPNGEPVKQVILKNGSAVDVYTQVVRNPVGGGNSEGIGTILGQKVTILAKPEEIARLAQVAGGELQLKVWPVGAAAVRPKEKPADPNK